MRVAVHFTDGEVIQADSDAASLTKMGFPVLPISGNNEAIWISLAAIKYVVLHGGIHENPVSESDPREADQLRKVVLRFQDGETIRTFQDDSFGQDSEGVTCRLWNPSTKRLERVLVSLHSLKGIFFVKEWDSRSAAEKIAQIRPVRRGVEADKPASTWAPEIDADVHELANVVRQQLATAHDAGLLSDEPEVFGSAVRRQVERLVREEKVTIPEDLRERVVDDILFEALGYGPIDPLLRDAAVTEIMVNALDNVYVERHGVLERTKIRFADEQQVLNLIRRMVSAVGRTIDEAHPMVDARLPDGSRINAIIRPASLTGPSLTVRKFGAALRSLDDLVTEGTMSPAMKLFLAAAVAGRANLLISGGTGSGKTTTLNILGSLIPDAQRVVTIEDAAELDITHPHVISLEQRQANVEGRGELTLRHLLKNSLRMRPDRILVGEVRGAEALDMLQAMNTGHDGAMSTIHSNSARDALTRLETMVMMAAVDLPLPAVRAQIASAINLIVHQARMPDGRRKMVQVSELVGYDEQGPLLRDVFVLKAGGSRLLEYAPTGYEPRCLEKFAFHGVVVPSETFDPEVSRFLPAGSEAALPPERKHAVIPTEPSVREIIVPIVMQAGAISSDPRISGVAQAVVDAMASAAQPPAPAPPAIEDRTPVPAPPVAVAVAEPDVERAAEEPAEAVEPDPPPTASAVEAPEPLVDDASAAEEPTMEPVEEPRPAGLERAVARLVSDYHLDPRLAATITRALTSGGVTAADHMAQPAVSAALATRHLQAAALRGLLSVQTGGGGRRYVPGPHLHRSLADVLEVPRGPLTLDALLTAAGDTPAEAAPEAAEPAGTTSLPVSEAAVAIAEPEAVAPAGAPAETEAEDAPGASPRTRRVPESRPSSLPGERRIAFAIPRRQRERTTGEPALMHYLKARRQIRAGVETVLGSAGLEPRLGRALFDAFDGREVEVAVYEGLARISPEEAESDLHAAAERGLLARRAAGRGFVAGPRLYAAVAEALSLPATGPVSREWIVSELARPQPAAVAADQ